MGLFKRIGAAVAGGIFLTSPAFATDVTFNITSDLSDGLREALRGASLSRDIAKQDGTTSDTLLSAAQADYRRLIEVLYARGYFGPVINITVDGREAAAIPPFSPPENIDQITITIDPGDRFRFGEVSIAPLAPDTELPDGFETGKPAQSLLIGDAVGAAIDAWRGDGHAKAAVNGQRVIADHTRAVLNTDVTLAPGPRLNFGDLIVDGNSAVRTERIIEIAGLPTGQVFDPEEQSKAANRLRKTGAFRSVALREEDNANADGTLDITASLVDEKPRKFGFGAELASIEGLSLSGFWMHRNLLGGAERLRFDGAVSGIAGDTGGVDSLLSVSFTRPATFRPDTTLSLLAEAEVLDEPDFYENRILLSAGLIREFSDSFQVGVGVGLRFTDIRDDFGERTIHQLTFPLFATLDERDDTLNPRAGYFADVDLEPFAALGDGGSGARIFADTRAYYALGDNAVLAGRAQIGSVLGAAAADVPPDMLFFSGGGGTVRGQPYQSLGVDLPSGDTVGGRSFVGLSAEIRYDVSNSISVVGFADTGFVGADSIPGQNGEWQSGAGLGVRYNTGIGPIRFDVAAPVGGSTGDGVQFYIGIGQAF